MLSNHKDPMRVACSLSPPPVNRFGSVDAPERYLNRSIPQHMQIFRHVHRCSARIGDERYQISPKASTP